MATPIIMPRQGQSVESCIITKWHKQAGDYVEVGDPLFSYETDKASFDEESEIEGVLLDIFFEEGDDVPVLTNVCAIGQEGENIEALRPEGAPDEVEQEIAAPEETAREETVQEEIVGEEIIEADIAEESEPIIKISPRARRLARANDISYEDSKGTGPYGRIIERDIEDLLDERTIPSYIEDRAVSDTDYERVPITNIRRLIGESMHRSLQSTAQLTLDTTFDATDILSLRERIKANKDELGLGNITLNDMILFAVSRALIEHREMNAYITDEDILLFNRVNLGVAVDTDRGLMVPTIFDAETKSLEVISNEAKALIDECRTGSINPDKLQDGTFTVTNLGTLGVEYFTPVLNPPQVGILGVNTITTRIRETQEGYEHYSAMGLSLTFDHRAIDGAPAARFLADIKNKLENFTLLLTR